MKMKKIFLLSIMVFTFVSCSQKQEKITELSQLSNKRIAVLTGSAGDIASRKNFPDAKILDIVASADAAYAVKIGKADAFVYIKDVLLNIVKSNPELTILDQPVASVEVAAAFNKNNNKLLADFNEALAILEREGTLGELKDKWIETEYKTVPGIDNIQNDGANGIIKLGTCAQVEPYTFLYNNKITGLDIEIALRIGKILGKRIEIMDMSFESLIPALQSGKIDIALSNFNITEERKQYINFSTPYVVNDISALVRRQ